MLIFILYFLLGAICGAVFFYLLKLTVDYLVKKRNPMLLVLSSWVRILALIAVIYFASQKNPLYILTMLAGITVARIIIVKREGLVKPR